MEFSLVNPLNPLVETITFVPNPPTIDVSDGARVRTYTPQDLGSTGFPRGRSPWKLSMRAFLPGGARVGGVFAPALLWRPPADVVYQLESWMGNGIKLTFIVTDTEINKDVFIVQFARTWGSGYGDVPYTLELQEWRDILVPVDSSSGVTPTGAVGVSNVGLNTGVSVTSDIPEGTSRTRTQDAPSSTHTVTDGETLYIIAAKELGDGDRWNEIYDLNRDQISDPDVIQVGQTLKMPVGNTSPLPVAPGAQPTNAPPGPLAP